MENIVEKRRNCSWGAISPLFHNIFNISLTSKVQLPISLLNVVNQIIFSSILQTWYVELRISRSISESPLEFEITRVDCIIITYLEISFICPFIYPGNSTDRTMQTVQTQVRRRVLGRLILVYAVYCLSSSFKHINCSNFRTTMVRGLG